jgi:hypothetical protein
MIQLGIIGTTGRYDNDKKRLEKKHLTWILHQVEDYIENILLIDKKNIILISGGAAWTDHVAIQLYLSNQYAGLKLYLPSKFDVKHQQYINTHEGRLLNALHLECQEKTGICTFKELAKAIHGKNKVNIIIKHGFFPRNTLMAKNCDHLLVFTFNHNGPVDRDVLDIWKKTKHNNKVHFDLSQA